MLVRFSQYVSILAIAYAVLGCSSDGVQSDAADARPRAVATTGPVGDLVRRLAGDRIAVEVMMGPGVDPHLYRAVPSDLRELDAADLILFNGLHLEGRMGDVFEAMGKKKFVVAVTDGLLRDDDPRLLSPEQNKGLHDPHVWHDVSIWVDCARYVTEKLCEFDPEGATHYRANAEAYLAELETLHTECQQRMDAIPESSRVLVTSHDAFAYFGRAYGVEPIGLKGISTEDEVDLGQMEAVADLLVERRAPCVFVESTVAPQLLESLAESCRSRGHAVRIGGELYADALGPKGSGAEDYAGMIRANVETIVKGLGTENKDED